MRRMQEVPMAKPQQPELHRSGRGATDPASAKAAAGEGAPAAEPGPGPVPPDNQPGHHPEHEQDKPDARRRPRPTEPARREVSLGDLRFSVLDAGPTKGDAVVLLHGFPQQASSWLPVMRALAAAGYRAVAPDQRGYSPGARPRRTTAYRLPRLAADIVELADELDIERFNVVGHDWGGVVGWAVAAGHPGRVLSWTAVSTPHPRAYLRALTRGSQALRSGYIALFRLPGLSEALLGAGGGTLLRRALTASGLPDDPAKTYSEAMTEAGALRAALSWYRAARPRDLAAVGRVKVPTLYVWGRRDPALGAAAARATRLFVSGPYRFEPLDTGHWLPETEADTLAAMLLEHVGAHSGRREGAAAS
jgi:pimeloyl-ACP methyl ester carboxylesterase